ncbi:MAG: hypothetical protein NVSMB9_23530 [Isosphaeraceae bacterium]
MRNSLIALLVLSLLAGQASASSPNLASVLPPGGQRGTEFEVTFTGDRLTDTKEVLFYTPGISVTKLQVVDDAHVKATLKVAPDAKPGLRDLRLRTATGLTALRTLSIGALKNVNEVEPNNDFAAPQAIEMNVTVNGVAENEDIDYYAVQAKKGDRITAEVEGTQLGITLFDPYVAILNTKRFELASSDDAALIWQDALASVVAPEDGTYLIAVPESA